jgi:hypothetical protein
MPEDCVQCDEPVAIIKCNCRKTYCSPCWDKHLRKRPDHYRVAPSRFNQAVAWIIGGSSLPATQIFEKDEGAKWFGFFEKTNVIRSTVYQIVETPRFSELMETSARFSPQSPKRQYPSLVSFVGITGDGKSTLSK